MSLEGSKVTNLPSLLLKILLKLDLYQLYMTSCYQVFYYFLIRSANAECRGCRNQLSKSLPFGLPAWSCYSGCAEWLSNRDWAVLDTCQNSSGLFSAIWVKPPPHQTHWLCHHNEFQRIHKFILAFELRPDPCSPIHPSVLWPLSTLLPAFLCPWDKGQLEILLTIGLFLIKSEPFLNEPITIAYPSITVRLALSTKVDSYFQRLALREKRIFSKLDHFPRVWQCPSIFDNSHYSLSQDYCWFDLFAFKSIL